MMEKLLKCPSCLSDLQMPFITALDHSISKENFDIVRCLQCQLLFTNPRPKNTEAGAYYQSESYISHSNTQVGLINKLYHAVRKITLSQKTNWIEKEKTGNKKLLDIGCGNGHFLKACQNMGWYISGMELDKSTALRAAKLLGIPIYPNLNSFDELEKYQVISLWHVLEHVYELHDYFNFFKTRLDHGGKLLLALPNSKSFDAHYFKKYWAAFDVPRHIYHFDNDTIQTLAAQHGFKLKKKKAQLFDSFYIALLSHENKTGNKKLLSSLIIGLYSNLSAWLKTGNYSSNLYIFEHA